MGVAELCSLSECSRGWYSLVQNELAPQYVKRVHGDPAVALKMRVSPDGTWMSYLLDMVSFHSPHSPFRAASTPTVTSRMKRRRTSKAALKLQLKDFDSGMRCTRISCAKALQNARSAYAALGHNFDREIMALDTYGNICLLNGLKLPIEALNGMSVYWEVYVGSNVNGNVFVGAYCSGGSHTLDRLDDRRHVATAPNSFTHTVTEVGTTCSYSSSTQGKDDEQDFQMNLERPSDSLTTSVNKSAAEEERTRLHLDHADFERGHHVMAVEKNTKSQGPQLKADPSVKYAYLNPFGTECNASNDAEGITYCTQNCHRKCSSENLTSKSLPTHSARRETQCSSLNPVAVLTRPLTYAVCANTGELFVEGQQITTTERGLQETELVYDVALSQRRASQRAPVVVGIFMQVEDHNVSFSFSIDREAGEAGARVEKVFPDIFAHADNDVIITFGVEMCLQPCDHTDWVEARGVQVLDSARTLKIVEPTSATGSMVYA